MLYCKNKYLSNSTILLIRHILLKMNTSKVAELVSPYPTYVPNKIVAICVAAIVSISLIAWFVQSYQLRFRPPRLTFLLLLSHMAIFIELIIRALVPANEQKTRNSYIIMNGLFAIGQRMIIVGNYVFVLQIHYQKSLVSRIIFISAILCVVTSGFLTIPANLFLLNPNKKNSSFLFRELSASILIIVTLLFYPILYWSKTLKDMTIQAAIVIIVSSMFCAIAAIFSLIQSLPSYSEEISNHETWFYILQMIPIILAHFTWSIFHPKRSLTSSNPLLLTVNDETSQQS